MAVNRVTRSGSESTYGFKTWLASWGTALPGPVVGVIVLLALLTGALPSGLSGSTLILFGAIVSACVLRLTWPPTAKHPLVDAAFAADMVVLPLAAVQLAAWILGHDAGIVFPLTLLVVAWAAASLSKMSAGTAFGYAILCELAHFVGRGAWMGEATELLMHAAFIAAFAVGGKVLLRMEVANTRQRLADEAEEDAERVDGFARSFGLDEAPAVDQSLATRVDTLHHTFTQVLVMSRRAVNAHSAVLMTRDDTYDALQVFAAATPETDLLATDPAELSAGVLAVLGKLEAEDGEEPVLRLSPIEGRNAELPYYTRTPARIRSVMAVAIKSGEHLLGVLLFDRTAGPGFEESELPHARNAAKLLARLIETERTLVAADHRSETLNHLLEAHHDLTEAFGPDQMYQSVLDAANRLASLRFGALLVRDEKTGRPKVVNAIGERAHECVGLGSGSESSLAAMVFKTPTVIPPSRTWHPAHGTLLGTESGPKLREGDPIIAIPLVAQGQAIGAMVLLGHDLFNDDTLNMLKLLAGSAAAAVQHALALSELESRATTDGLTGLDNRATIQAKLDQSLARSGRSNQSVAALMLDVDHFKTVNDEHGHQAGDMVLRQIAKTLADSKRLNDSAGRWGGEEFVLVLEDTDPSGARVVAERIRERIAELTFPTAQGSFRVTASIGVALSPAHADQREPLLKKADTALYQAKSGGRNLVMISGEQPFG